MTSVSKPTTGSLRQQRSRKLSLRLGAAALTVAAGIAIAFAITNVQTGTPSVEAPASGGVVDRADMGLLKHAATYTAPAAAFGAQGGIDSADMGLLKHAATYTAPAAAAFGAQGGIDSADIGLLKHAATYRNQPQRPVDSADVGLLRTIGVTAD
jgi:hypothetical protein